MTIAEKNLIDIYRKNGMGCTEIARNLNLSVNTVKSYCRRNNVTASAVSKRSGETVEELKAKGNKCRQCGAVLQQTAHRKARQFCSDACRLQWWHTNRHASANAEEKVCPACRMRFVTNRGQKYCSHACYIASRFGVKSDHETDQRSI